MKLVERFLTKNPCYTAGRKIDVKGLMLHSVGCSQPKASAFINSWNSPTFERACVHGFIDRNIIELFFNDGYQTSTNTFFFTGGNFINEVEIKCDHGENGFNVDFKAAQITKK